MHDSKIIEILKSLTKKEFKDLESFIEQHKSIKSHKPTQVLFSYLKKQYPNFEKEKIDRMVVYKVLFDKEVFNEKKLNYIKSDLTEIVEDFLAYSQYLDIKEQSNYFLAQAYRKKGLNKLLEITLREQRKKLNDSNILKDEMHLLYRYLCETTTLLSFEAQNVEPEENIFEINRTLDYFYIAGKLKLIAKAYNDQLPKSHTIWVIDEILNRLDNDPNLSQEPIILIYKQVIRLIQHKNEENYNLLLELLQKHKKCFTIFDIDNFYLYALNFLIGEFNAGNTQYLTEIIKLYQTRINEGILELGYSDFTTIAKWGANAKIFDETKAFIDENIHKLPKNIQETVYNFCMGLLYYAQNKFRDAILSLNFVKFIFLDIEADTRVVGSRCFFEVEEMEMAKYYNDRLKILIKESKPMPIDYYETHHYYVKEFIKIFHSVRGKTEEDKDKFIEGILANPSTGGTKGWIYRTATRLLKRNTKQI